ncbi:MAG: hypothetical protein GXO03_02850 [Aquificae bacterium]|nr:hypothetical protein [Aquificota bacterium]
MRLDELPEVKSLDELIKRKKTFILYVREELLKPQIKEMHDLDVVVPEIKRSFPFAEVYRAEASSLGGKYRPPSVVFFKEGKEILRAEGIQPWAFYARAVKELYGC